MENLSIFRADLFTESGSPSTNPIHQKYIQTNHNGAFFVGPLFPWVVKSFVKSLLKKHPLPKNFDHQKKQQSTFPKESQSGITSEWHPKMSQIEKKKKLQVFLVPNLKVASFILLMVQKSGLTHQLRETVVEIYQWFTKCFFRTHPKWFEGLKSPEFWSCHLSHQRLWNKPLRGFRTQAFQKCCQLGFDLRWFENHGVSHVGITHKGWPIKAVWLLMPRIPNVTQLGNLRLLVRCGWKKWSKKNVLPNWWFDGDESHGRIRKKSPNPYKSKAFWFIDAGFPTPQK